MRSGISPPTRTECEPYLEPTLAHFELLVQRYAAANIGGHIQIFALVDRWFALVEASLRHDLQRELALAHF